MAKIAVGSDHAGFELKKALLNFLARSGHEPADLGARNRRPVDYPDLAEAVSKAVRSGRSRFGILVCGSGVGICIAANKMPGIRAALCHDSYSAAQSRAHDDANVLCLGSRVIGPDLALDLVRIWLKTGFSGEARHRRRIKKIALLEKRGGTSIHEDHA
ncbi:MAG: ribose 5-phosphate isomerase B [Elusimicrobia bacterium]|nr:ribose 5-phosphate isomerase B [Elusimicrobiota bacterium]